VNVSFFQLVSLKILSPSSFLSLSLALSEWETGEEKVKINLKIKNTPHNFDHSTL